jgi:sugar fermentation stimulation protein A
VRFNPALTPCTFVRRYKRFFADVHLQDGTELTVHCPNTGRMTSCVEPGGPAWISDSGNPKRKLRHTLEITQVGDARIFVHSTKASTVAVEAISAGLVEGVSGVVKTEVRVGDSRLDIQVGDDTFIEVKCVTLGVGDGVSRFPDATSVRAVRHLGELTRCVEAGFRAMLLFVSGRDDTRQVEPADEIHPAYGEALRAALRAGVEARAYRCDVSPEGVWLRERVPLVT